MLSGDTKMKVVVTGAGGFIGSHLCRYLKNRGYWVRAVDIKWDNYITGYADQFVTTDLRKTESSLEVVKGMDRVYNLAANMGGNRVYYNCKSRSDER